MWVSTCSLTSVQPQSQTPADLLNVSPSGNQEFMASRHHQRRSNFARVAGEAFRMLAFRSYSTLGLFRLRDRQALRDIEETDLRIPSKEMLAVMVK